MSFTLQFRFHNRLRKGEGGGGAVTSRARKRHAKEEGESLDRNENAAIEVTVACNTFAATAAKEMIMKPPPIVSVNHPLFALLFSSDSMEQNE